MNRLALTFFALGCATAPVVQRAALPDFPLLAGTEKPPPVGDPLRGCAAPGETLGACTDFPAAIPGVPATTVRACAFTPELVFQPRRVSILQEGRVLGCVVMTDLARWDAKGDSPGQQLFFLDPKFAAAGLLVFEHHGYASDTGRFEILQVGAGTAHTVFRGQWLNFERFDDLDHDGSPELLGTENSPQNMYCDYVPTAVFTLRDGRFVRDDAAMERFAKKVNAPWWGPEPIIDGEGGGTPFTLDCHQKLDVLRKRIEQE